MPTFAEFSMSEGSFVMVTMGFSSEDVSLGTSSTITHPTGNNATFYDTGSGSGLTWNAGAAVVTDFRVRFEQAVNGNRRALGARTIKQQVPGGRINVTGSFRAEYDSVALFNDFRAATSRALAIKLVGDAISGGNYELQLNVPVAVITPTGEPSVDDEGIIYADIPFQGFFDGTNRELNMVIKNSLASGAIA